MNDRQRLIGNDFHPLDRDGELLLRGRHLPHWTQAGVTYFVTFRLSDSLPIGRLVEWKAERERWLERHPKPWTHEERREHAHFFARVERWLDAGHGDCILADDTANKIVASSLAHFDGERYILDQFSIMPNHVHVLVRSPTVDDLSNILHSWKSYTAHQLNKLMGRSGSVWQDESFDHIVRSVEQLKHYRRYILEKSGKARLKDGFKLGRGIGLDIA